ncbi:unnamed protein product, partial [Polarella glacialis]
LGQPVVELQGGSEDEVDEKISFAALCHAQDHSHRVAPCALMDDMYIERLDKAMEAMHANPTRLARVVSMKRMEMCFESFNHSNIPFPSSGAEVEELNPFALQSSNNSDNNDSDDNDSNNDNNSNNKISTYSHDALDLHPGRVPPPLARCLSEDAF